MARDLKFWELGRGASFIEATSKRKGRRKGGCSRKTKLLAS